MRVGFGADSFLFSTGIDTTFQSWDTHMHEALKQFTKGRKSTCCGDSAAVHRGRTIHPKFTHIRIPVKDWPQRRSQGRQSQSEKAQQKEETGHRPKSCACAVEQKAEVIVNKGLPWHGCAFSAKNALVPRCQRTISISFREFLRNPNTSTSANRKSNATYTKRGSSSLNATWKSKMQENQLLLR